MTRLPVRGRGASHNPPNRFEPVHVERDGWTDPDDPAPRTRLLRDASRSVIATNRSPDVGFEASVNPYRGCEHGCVYCMSGDTPILMGDGTTRRLSDLKPGEEIYGTVRKGWYRRYTTTRVLAHWETEKEAYRITLGDGTRVTASGDHRFLTARGWKFVTGAQQGKRRRPHLTLNDRLMGTGGLELRRKASDQYRLGYLSGVVRGDGLLARYEYENRGRMDRQHQFRLAMADEPALERTAEYLEAFGVSVSFFAFQPATRRRRKMTGIRTSRRADFERITGLVAWPHRPQIEWARGFLAGIFDAEGSYSSGVLRISNTSAEIVDAIRRSLRAFRFDAALENVDRHRAGPIQVVRLRGGLSEHLRFFHVTDPAIRRKSDISGRALKNSADLGITSIEPAGRMTLFDITTGTGDFIANGVVSHNCYARPFHEYLGMSPGLDFETKILVKEDAPELLRRELSSRAWKPKVLAMSGVTDPYQPAERRLGVTRGCLEVLAEFRNPVSIITKNHLVTRDLDLLAELAAHDAVRVTLSITTLRNELQRVMEPRTSVPARRLRAVRELAEAGIPVGVNVAPVIPGLTEHEMPAILEAAAEAGARGAGYVVLRLPHGVKELFETWLEQRFPDRKKKVLGRMRAIHDGELYRAEWRTRQRGEGPFAEQIRRIFEVTTARLGLDGESPPLSTEAFRRPGEVRQLGLFEDRS